MAAKNARSWILNWTAIGVIAMALFAAAAYGVSLASHAEAMSSAADAKATKAKDAADSCNAGQKEYAAKDEQRHTEILRRLDRLQDAIERKHP